MSEGTVEPRRQGGWHAGESETSPDRAPGASPVPPPPPPPSASTSHRHAPGPPVGHVVDQVVDRVAGHVIENVVGTALMLVLLAAVASAGFAAWEFFSADGTGGEVVLNGGIALGTLFLVCMWMSFWNRRR